jgi:hypothetical protein
MNKKIDRDRHRSMEGWPERERETNTNGRMDRGERHAERQTDTKWCVYMLNY